MLSHVSYVEFVCFHTTSVFECQISTQTEGEANDVPLCLPQCFLSSFLKHFVKCVKDKTLQD